MPSRLNGNRCYTQSRLTRRLSARQPEAPAKGGNSGLPRSRFGLVWRKCVVAELVRVPPQAPRRT
jgi:hypothetical protein